MDHGLMNSEYSHMLNLPMNLPMDLPLLGNGHPLTSYISACTARVWRKITTLLMGYLWKLTLLRHQTDRGPPKRCQHVEDLEIGNMMEKYHPIILDFHIFSIFSGFL